MQYSFEILEIDEEQAKEIRFRFSEAARLQGQQGKQRVLVLDLITDAIYFDWL